jgi:hypothetical protein
MAETNPGTIRSRKENTLATLSGVRQLKKERGLVERQLSGLNAALAAFAGLYRDNAGIEPRRKISAKGRARIAAGQRARWAKIRGQSKDPKPGKRTMSASARRKIAVAQRVRWAKVRRYKMTYSARKLRAGTLSVAGKAKGNAGGHGQDTQIRKAG